MNQDRNYYKKMEEELKRIASESPEKRPSLLLHACCCPCSSAVIELLHTYFEITVFYYNPNITEEEEFEKRFLEFFRLKDLAPFAKDIRLVKGKYDPESFLEMAKGREHLPERGARCYDCYELRLRESLSYAAENGFDYYTTTLSISPYKNADWINEIGQRLVSELSNQCPEENHIPKFLFSDFKKKDGYKRSTQLSQEYGLYRQNYCGCQFSKPAEAECTSDSASENEG